jgi:phosphoglycolate phosphatase-like HAD superfamily hydrolase
MASRKQAELPNTRRADEGEIQKAIKELDDALEEFEKAKGKRIKAAQLVKAARDKAQELLKEHGIEFYVYEDLGGVERRFFTKQTVGTCKVKKEKRTSDIDSADGDEE